MRGTAISHSRERGYARICCAVPKKPLTEQHDRLATIARNNRTLGAGMSRRAQGPRVAWRRHVLGAEQSGHVAGVGFDLYVRLVGERWKRTGRPPGRTVNRGDRRGAIDLPVDDIPVEYVDSDRLRLEAYRKLAAATDDDAVTGDSRRTHRPLRRTARGDTASGGDRPTATAVPRTGVAELRVVGTSVKISPLTLLDSEQVRLKRIYSSATYRATTSVITLPLPRTGGVGSARCATTRHRLPHQVPVTMRPLAA